jgi:1,2-diacylglycerol 3-beta-glucosyltransferase
VSSRLLTAGTAVDTTAIVLCVCFLCYVSAILFPFLRKRAEQAGDATGFSWHLLVPCLNEAQVIGRTIRDLRLTHPAAHVWCIDDGSDDGTARVLVEFADDLQVHVVRRKLPAARTGKGAALNDGWRAVQEWLLAHPTVSAADVVVGVVDADARLAPAALAVISGPKFFGDPRVAAVQIQVRMLNRGLGADRLDGNDPAPSGRARALLVQLQDLEFRTVIAAMQGLRRRSGSVGMGGNGQFARLAVLDQIASEYGTPWHGALLEDFELGLHVLLVGHRNEYCDDTWVAQEGLPHLRPLIRQRTRWAQGGMQCGRYMAPIMRSRTLSTPAALEINYFLLIPWTQLLGTVAYLAAASVMGYYATTSEGGVVGWFESGGWGLLPLIVVFGILPVAIWGPVYRARCEPTITRRRALLISVAYWLYTYVMIIGVWAAFFRLLRKRHGWVRSPRVRSDRPSEPPVRRDPVLRRRPPARHKAIAVQRAPNGARPQTQTTV